MADWPHIPLPVTPDVIRGPPACCSPMESKMTAGQGRGPVARSA